MQYTMKAYPTVYQGRVYRSRLEARWAAFLSICGFKFEYEPFDLGGWTPDFLLSRGSVHWPNDVLVEVKPVTEFCEETAEKMIRSTSKMNPRPNLMLVGLNPKTLWSEWFDADEKRVETESPTDLSQSYTIRTTTGWFWTKNRNTQWTPANMGWYPHLSIPKFEPSIFARNVQDSECERFFLELVSKGEKSLPPDGWSSYAGRSWEIWNEATNAVQWRPE